MSQSKSGAMDIEVERKTITASTNSPEDFVVDKKIEKRIKWKCDLKLLPPLMFLFIITFMDRTNIANAKIEGMTTELKMKNTDYNKSLWILNIPYICLGLPSNMLMKSGFVKPYVYLSVQMFCWGMSNFRVYREES